MGIFELIVSKQSWFRRRFLDFRNGHSIYLAFALNFLTFTTVIYTLVLDKIQFLKIFNLNLWQFVLLFIPVYIIIAILIGDYHLKRQMPSEVRQGVQQNPYTYRAMEGKESEYNIPQQVAMWEIEKKRMQMLNQLADAVSDLAKVNGKPMPVITERFGKEFQTADFWLRVSKYLQEGMHINDALERAKQ